MPSANYNFFVLLHQYHMAHPIYLWVFFSSVAQNANEMYHQNALPVTTIKSAGNKLLPKILSPNNKINTYFKAIYLSIIKILSRPLF